MTTTRHRTAIFAWLEFLKPPRSIYDCADEFGITPRNARRTLRQLHGLGLVVHDGREGRRRAWIATHAIVPRAPSTP